MRSDRSNQFKHGVLDYYEKNTRWFRFFGTSGRSQAIHRAVWAEGIKDRQGALNYVDDQILAQISAYKKENSLERVRVVDLGCGVGGSLQKMANEMGSEISGLGITLSPRQAQFAQQRSNRLGTQAHCYFLVADFHAVPFYAEKDIAFSIEAFAHAVEPETYFAEVARVLSPGGRLILCDDFQTVDSTANGSNWESHRWLQIFKAGWLIPHLLSPPQVANLAQKYRFNLIGEQDLTRFIRQKNLPRHLIPIFEFMLNRRGALHPLLGSIVGGIALEHCLGNGLVSYRFLVFEKQA